jgi:ketol-acid reductoisomerase
MNYLNCQYSIEKKLYEMNRIISDTAEYGCYLFDHACKPLLTDFMKTIETNVIGKSFSQQMLLMH